MKKLLVLSMLVVGCAVLPVTVEASEEMPPTIAPYAAIKEWRYKSINGWLYKRLYNATTQKWEGDWIKC